MSEGGPGSANYSCDSTSNDGRGPASEGRKGLGKNIQSTPLLCALTGCVAAVWCLTATRVPTKGVYDGANDDGPGSARRGRGLPCRG